MAKSLYTKNVTLFLLLSYQWRLKHKQSISFYSDNCELVLDNSLWLQPVIRKVVDYKNVATL